MQTVEVMPMTVHEPILLQQPAVCTALDNALNMYLMQLACTQCNIRRLLTPTVLQRTASWG